jgi:membrane protein DedA with SNARE-associated domain
MSDWIHGVIDAATSWLSALGYWGIMLGLMIEIIPSEIVLAFGGYLVSKGEINYWIAVLFGVIGGVIAQIFVYWIGRYGGRPVLEKFGKYILINKHHIDVSEQWFNKYGTGVIFTARFIPVVRHAISVPAGMARMPLSKFTLLTTLAVIPWSMFFIYLGMKLGDNWQNIDETAAEYMREIMWGAVALTVLYVIYLLYKRSRRKAVPVQPATAGVSRPETDGKLRVLDRLGSEYRVLDGRRVLPGNEVQQAEYIVVGPNGVFHIELNRKAGEIRFAELIAEPGTVGSPDDPTAQAYRREFALKNLLRRNQIKTDVVGIICLTDPKASIAGQSPAFAVLKQDELPSHIRAHKAKQPLNEEQVVRIVRLLEEQDSSVKS